MAVIKCKMCGGDLNITEGTMVCECEYCGSKQTIPNADDEKKMTLFARANRLLRNCEFDKAAGVYESIATDFPEEAEAYWGNLLCKYGIEYVDDPVTGRKVPTCHRSGFDSVMDDQDFELVMEYADPIAKKVYREQAKEIEDIRKGIVDVSGKEEPYDIFICYKETAPDGQRTLDSVLAQDVYGALEDKGYRVFFSRVSLEDKLGTEYEPYIFAALNSAKVMLAFGTDYDYYDAVWVKNEWSRFLKLMAKDKEKHLIPCYKNIDAYDIPKEFAKLQAQDMGKVGAVQDLIRGIEKILGKKNGVEESSQNQGTNQTVVQQVIQGSTTANAQVKRGNLALEDGEWKKADSFFEEALNLDPENAYAYLGKLMAQLQVRKQEGLGNLEKPFDGLNTYWKVIRYGDDELKGQMESYLQAIRKRIADVQALEEEKAREAIRKEEELKEEAKELFVQLIRLYNNSGKVPTTSELLAQTKEEKQSVVDEIEKQIVALKLLKEELPEMLTEIDRLKNTLKAEEQEISSLGMFSGGKKKELKSKIEQTKTSIEQLNTKMKGMNSQVEVQNIINELQASRAQREERYDEKIGRLKSKLEEDRECEKRDLSLEEIIEKLQERPELKQELRKHVGFKEFFKVPKTIRDMLKLRLMFGRYAQELGADKSPIEWEILEVKDNKALIISKYAIDNEKYHTEDVNATWETCTLRKWLNDDFLKKAFSAEEQEWIQNTEVVADKNPKHNTNPGNPTVDKIFLLSIKEANQYYTSDIARRCAPTAYAKCYKVKVSDENKTESGEAAGLWWLRSPGKSRRYAANVDYSGLVWLDGDLNYCCDVTVRPALWISIEP